MEPARRVIRTITELERPDVPNPKEADDIPLAPEFTSSGGLTMRAASGVEGRIRYRHLGDRPATAERNCSTAPPRCSTTGA